MVKQRLGVQRRTLLSHDQKQGPLLPPLVLDGDDGSLQDIRMRERDILELNRGNPLAT